MQGNKKMWIILAVLSSIFAALTSILAKVGIEGVNSHLTTAIRTLVVVVMAWGIVFLTHNQHKELGFPCTVRNGNWCIVAFLLHGAADGRSVESCGNR